MSEFAEEARAARRPLTYGPAEARDEESGAPGAETSAEGADPEAGTVAEARTEAESAAVAEAGAGAESAAVADDLADEGPPPLGIGVRPTGDAGVDAELRRLEDADHLAVSGHLEVYEDVHRGLREQLAALDRTPTPSHTPRS